jgi:hypothetical protein
MDINWVASWDPHTRSSEFKYDGERQGWSWISNLKYIWTLNAYPCPEWCPV